MHSERSALESFNMGEPGALSPDFLCPAKGHLFVWRSPQAAAWESLQGFLRTPHHSLAIINRNSSVSRHLSLALPQVLEILPQPLHFGTALSTALHLTVACVFRPPSSHSSPATPPYWEFCSHKAAFSLPSRKKKGPMGLPRDRTGESNCRVLNGTPIS